MIRRDPAAVARIHCAMLVESVARVARTATVRA
jgi:hypothetical protein